MEFGGMQYLHFPIGSYSSGKETWDTYALRLRENLKAVKLEYRHKIPEDTYTPHITIHEGARLDADRGIQALIKESRQEPPLYFKTGYLTLYAKYPHGWDTLTCDPGCK